MKGDMMPNHFELVREKQNGARSRRKRGDALSKAGRDDDAIAAYRSAEELLKRALDILRDPSWNHLQEAEPPLSKETEQGKILRELVETYGARGGILRRLGDFHESLRSYQEGAALEERFQLPETYNRLNAVKYTLLAGETTLRTMEPKIRELAQLIEDSLRADQTLSDKGWAWADLADCRALLGEIEEAQKHYSTFIVKAEIRSPESTLEVLKQISSALEKSSDPDADRVTKAVQFIENHLNNR